MTIQIPRRLRRLWIWINTISVVDTIAPEDDFCEATRSGRKGCGLTTTAGDPLLRRVASTRDADQILIEARSADVFDLAAERHRRRLAAALIEECGQLTGSAFTFRKEK